MIYIRGNRRDYDRWLDLGNLGWGFSEVLPYFKKAEHQERGASLYHGTDGPLNVADLRSINPLSQAFVEAGVEVGLPLTSDFNGSEQDGVGFYQVTQKEGQRHSTAVGYLHPILHRPNLTVHTRALVTHLLLEKERAIGVTYMQEGQSQAVKAKRQVILCGGAVNSPQLLLLSGIGPADQLQALGIPVVVDLPGVGYNLQDHLAIPVSYACTQPVSLEGAVTPENLQEYLQFKRGPFTSNIAEAGAFVHTRSELPIPDVQFHFIPAYYLHHGFTRPEGYGFTLVPTLLRPESRGYISLRSRDPSDPPLIQPNYLESLADLQVLLATIQLGRRLASARAFDTFRGAELYPGEQAQSEEALINHIRSTAETLYHPVGTCKMGSDEMAVVDTHLRVHGIEGLRVVDASVMPMIIGGNTNAPTIMIAEKAANLIKGEASVTNST
jgi:choline dehydrogenase